MVVARRAGGSTVPTRPRRKGLCCCAAEKGWAPADQAALGAAPTSLAQVAPRHLQAKPLGHGQGGGRYRGARSRLRPLAPDQFAGEPYIRLGTRRTKVVQQ